MKRLVIAAVLVCVAFFACLYLFGKWPYRALFYKSVNDLQMSQKQFWEDSTITIWNRDVHVYAFTDQVPVGNNTFVCELAAETPALTNWGFVVAATNGTFIWIDKTREATIVRTSDHKFVTPHRFRDFWTHTPKTHKARDVKALQQTGA